MIQTIAYTMPSCSFSATAMIHTKRWNTRPHTEEELQWWMEQYVANAIPDYQMSAWLMAVCWRGMTNTETSCLTRCMVQSGHTLEWNRADFPYLVDKHSTGGVGDKISLILAPLVAACSSDGTGDCVRVNMMAGRGLDFTGGTIDKLESIPGYRSDLSVAQFQHVVRTVGCSIVSAGQDMVLADRKLYALRDVTGTVSCIPLQTASIVSKKIAEGPHSLILDVKYGRAAFQANVEEACELATSMIATAQANGVSPTTAFLTRMDHPIGCAIGNWLEVKECIAMMKGGGAGAADLQRLVLVEAAQILQQSNKYPERTLSELVDLAITTLNEGKVFHKFRDMVEAHGGDVSVLDHPETYPEAKYMATVVSREDGYIIDIDALVIGHAAVDLGAGRRVADEAVDPAAGIWLCVKVGQKVRNGELVATICTNRESVALDDVRKRVERAIRYAAKIVVAPSVITQLVTSDGMEDFDMPSQLLQL